MKHLDDIHLQAYIDDQLDPENRRIVEEHLIACAQCCSKLDDCRALCAQMRCLVPQEEMFRSDGEFWACLAGRLERRRARTWPWIAYLPPALLGTLGIALQTLVSLTLFFYALSSMGIIQSPGSVLASWPGRIVQMPLMQSILRQMGWNEALFRDGFLLSWGLASSAGQDLAFFGVLILVLGALLAAVLGIYLSWFFCWRDTEVE